MHGYWEPPETRHLFSFLQTHQKRRVAGVDDGLPEKREVAGSGIVPIHMPPLKSDPHKNTSMSRSGNRYRPNLENPTMPNIQSLEYDLPMAAGVSGSILLVAKAIHGFNKIFPTKIDTQHAILGGLMTLLNDGGHTLSEIMWSLNLLKTAGVDMGFGRQPVEPTHFVADYRQFFNSFSGKTKEALDAAQEHAYREMIKYRRDFKEGRITVEEPARVPHTLRKTPKRSASVARG